MKKIPAIIAAITFAAFPAFAQQQPQQQRMSAGSEQASLAYRQLGLAIEAMSRESVDATLQLQKHIAEMDAYLQACGDRPGCTVPVAK